MLQVEKLAASYGAIQALKGVSLEVHQGEIVCLIGANGAGKTTLLNCLSGVHAQRQGRLVYQEQDISETNAQQRVKMGIVQIPENRQLFGPMTVEENLEMGAYLRAKTSRIRLTAEMDAIFERFPILKDRRKQRAGTLSGGEQQMVAIGRGLMANPSLLLLDEPSLGLAPLVVKEIFRIIRGLREEGRTILLVEQNALGALTISDRAYVLETGRVSLSGPARDLMQDDQVRRSFLGQTVPEDERPRPVPCS
ncbi:MAG: ABC transporter ATP-binding protein [Deltaproteobacteria bacterium]|nr:ABC transporter ATP-binding protein [Deltaproteobacteria bacterium]